MWTTTYGSGVSTEKQKENSGYVLCSSKQILIILAASFRSVQMSVGAPYPRLASGQHSSEDTLRRGRAAG